MTEVLNQPVPLEMNGQISQSAQSSPSSSSSESKNSPSFIPGCPPTPDQSAESSEEKANHSAMDNLILKDTRIVRSESQDKASAETSDKMPGDRPKMLRAKTCPDLKYDDCREFDSFSGEWIDSKGQTVLISPWGVIRYPNNPKLRFEAIFMGPNHLSVTFDKDPKRRKFVGKLNHDCELLIWSNDTKWAKRGRLQSVTQRR